MDVYGCKYAYKILYVCSRKTIILAPGICMICTTTEKQKKNRVVVCVVSALSGNIYKYRIKEQCR